MNAHKTNTLKANEAIQNLKNSICIKDEKEQIQAIVENVFKLENYIERVQNNISYHKEYHYKYSDQCDELESKLYETEKTRDQLFHWVNDLYVELRKKKNEKKTKTLLDEIELDIKKLLPKDTVYCNCFWNKEQQEVINNEKP